MRQRLRRLGLLAPVLGLVDGIMNSLALAAGAIIYGDARLEAGLALRISVFSFATAGFVFFVATYAELRTELNRAARQLNLAEHGHLATTHLGRAILADALLGAAIASVASSLGAGAPLIIAIALPTRSWMAFVAAIGMLAGLGAVVAAALRANRIRWAFALAVGGVLVTAIGAELRIA
jgi:hypothetical protein